MDSLVVKPDDILERRRGTNDFSWASRTWNGSSYFVCGKAKDSKEVVDAVLASQNVRRVIREISERDGKPETTVSKEAEAILSEMAHDYHMYAIRWFGLILSKIAKRLYNSIQVNTERLDEIREAYKRCPVVLLPTHRSYVDFLLISYMSFHYSLPLPIIAAGMDFMGMAGMGEMLRKSGAFYIRRRFGGDVLYWALISEYVKTAVRVGGHPMEMFVEGTRSRSGKSLGPKIGLLSCVLELLVGSSRENEIPDILILPISMSYDRTLEEQLYAHELLGKPKPKESTNLLLKALRFLGSQRYGSVYVNFGKLISARKILEGVSTSSPSIDNPLSRSILLLATNVIVEHQQHLVVPIFAAVSLVMVSKISKGTMRVQFEELIHALKSIQAVLQLRKSSLGFPLIGEGFEANVRYALSVHSALVTVHSQSNSVFVNFESGDTVQHMVFQHYANQSLGILFPFSLSCFCNEAMLKLNPERSLELSRDKINKFKPQIQISENYVEGYSFMRQLFREDFVYILGAESQEAVWAANLLNSVAFKEVHPNYSQSHCGGGDDETKGSVFKILRRGLEPYIIAYWGVITCLIQLEAKEHQTRYAINRLVRMCQDFIQQELKANLNQEYGALSLDTLTNAVSSLLKTGSLCKDKLEDGSLVVFVKDVQSLSSVLLHIEPLMNANCFAVSRKIHSTKSGNAISKIDLLDSTASVQADCKDHILKSKL